MKCPSCHAPLVDQPGPDAGDPIMQRCTSCNGIWLGKDALEGEHAGIWANLESMGVDSIEFLGDYLCPACSASLTAVCPHDHPELRIDRCGSCHGLWLDRGELAKLHAILADYEDQHGAPAVRPPHWSMMKWLMYRMYDVWKGTYLD